MIDEMSNSLPTAHNCFAYVAIDVTLIHLYCQYGDLKIALKMIKMYQK